MEEEKPGSSRKGDQAPQAAGMKRGAEQEEGENVGQKRLKQDQSSAIAAADSRILREKFEKLESEALVEFLRGQGLNISVNTAENLVLNEVSGKTLVMKPMDELIAFLVNMVKLGAGPADAIAQFVFTTFAVRVPVKIGTSQARSVTLGLNATLESLLRHLTASNEYGIKEVPFNELLIKFNGSDKLQDLDIRLETLTKQLSKDQPLLISKMEAAPPSELFLNELSKFPKGQTAKFELGTGRSFQFAGREKFKADISQWLTDYFAAAKKNELNKDTILFPLLVGTQGIGKTRALSELKPIVETAYPEFEVFSIHITMNSRTPFDPTWEKEIGAEASIYLRAYSAAFGLPFPKVAAQLKNHAGLQGRGELVGFDLTKIFQELRAEHKIGEEKKCVFILTIDEIQFTFEKNEGMYSLMNRGDYFPTLLRFLQVLLFSPDSKNYYLPFFAGTVLQPLKTFMTESGLKNSQPNLSLLTLQEKIEILGSLREDFWKHAGTWKNKEHARFHRSLILIGGIPRALERLVEAANALDDLTNFRFTLFLGRWFHSYQDISIAKGELERVLSAHVLGDTVNYSAPILQDGETTYESLSSKGFLFLENHGTGQYVVRIPLPRLVTWNLNWDAKFYSDYPILQALHTLIEFLHVDEGSVAFETIYPPYLRLRLEILKKFRSQITLGDVFKGASVILGKSSEEPSFGQEVVEFDKITLSVGKSWNTLTDKQKKPGSIVFFPKNHPGFDSLLVLSVDKMERFFLIQTKQYSKEAGGSMVESFQKIHLKENQTFVAVTTGTLKGGDSFKELKESNSVIIEKHGIQAHFQGFHEAVCHENELQQLLFPEDKGSSSK